jgi:hypothetical protein
VGRAQQVNHHRESGPLVRALAVAVVVDTAEVDHRVERKPLVVAQPLANRQVRIRMGFDRRLSERNGE